MESLISYFDADNPCWIAELLRSRGEDAGLLPGLVDSGILSLNSGIYSLTDSGVKEFARVNKELFMGLKAGANPVNPRRSLLRTRLRILLDETHQQRWGLKDFRTDARLTFYPALKSRELFGLEGGRLNWLYPRNLLYLKLAEDFPIPAVDRRAVNLTHANGVAGRNHWRESAAGVLPVDLLYLSRYDFMSYQNFRGHSNDPLGLINANRFLFVFPDDNDIGNLQTIGNFHLWLNYLRRVQIPGYVDCDTQEQFSVSWLIFATEREAEAARITEKLSVHGETLLGEASPCEIWSISLEALTRAKEKHEIISELLIQIAMPIQRDILSTSPPNII